jgi:septum formation inhibitor-activating ATPase MinD
LNIDQGLRNLHYHLFVERKKLLDCYGVFGCKKKVRKNMRKEKYMRNKVNLMDCMIQENKKKKRRNKEERNAIIFLSKKYH